MASQTDNGAHSRNAKSTADVEGSALAAFVARFLRRNLSLLAVDYGLFGLGMTFASLSTIAPAFAERLGASNLAIGLIPAIMTLGYSLPPLFTANYTERLPRKLPFVLIYTIGERLPLLFLALGAYLLAESSPGLALALLFVCLALISGIGGALMPAWMDLIGKVVPTTYRGRLFAIGSSLAAFLGLGGSALVGYYLEVYDFPLDYALSFGTGFLFLILSYVALALVREPAVLAVKPHVGFAEYIRRVPEILRGNPSFSWYLFSRVFAYLGMMATGFYTVYALRVLHAPEAEVARFTFILLAGQTVANIVFGYVADHLGHKLVLVAGAIAVALGNLVALVSGSVEMIYLVFFCLSVSTAAGSISSMTFSLEFAPPDERPTYTGLASTLVAPLAFIAPLIGGLLADSVGYGAVFVFAALAALVNAGLLQFRVSDPRHRQI